MWMLAPGAALLALALAGAGLPRYQLEFTLRVGSKANAVQAAAIRVVTHRARASGRLGTPLSAQFVIPQEEGRFTVVVQGTTIPELLTVILKAPRELMFGAPTGRAASRFSAFDPKTGRTTTLHALQGPDAQDLADVGLDGGEAGGNLLLTFAPSSRPLIDALGSAAGGRPVAIVVGGLIVAHRPLGDLLETGRLVLPVGLGLDARTALLGILRDPAGEIPALVELIRTGKTVVADSGTALGPARRLAQGLKW